MSTIPAETGPAAYQPQALEELLAQVSNRPVFPGANCEAADPDVFHPAKGQDGSEAKRVCQMNGGCPWLRDCLLYALTHADGRVGVWGGTTAGERRTLRRDYAVEIDAVKQRAADSAATDAAVRKAAKERTDRACRVAELGDAA